VAKGEAENSEAIDWLQHIIACQFNNGTFYVRVILQKCFEKILNTLLLFLSNNQQWRLQGFNLVNIITTDCKHSIHHILDTFNTIHTLIWPGSFRHCFLYRYRWQVNISFHVQLCGVVIFHWPTSENVIILFFVYTSYSHVIIIERWASKRE